jgi:Protein of Unknown function (DUF2784)
MVWCLSVPLINTIQPIAAGLMRQETVQQMIYRVFADFVVLLHLAFVLFAVLGGILMFKWKRAAWFHIPAALWAALIEFVGWECPLTPLENWLRREGGEAGY